MASSPVLYPALALPDLHKYPCPLFVSLLSVFSLYTTTSHSLAKLASFQPFACQSQSFTMSVKASGTLQFVLKTYLALSVTILPVLSTPASSGTISP